MNFTVEAQVQAPVGRVVGSRTAGARERRIDVPAQRAETNDIVGGAAFGRERGNRGFYRGEQHEEIGDVRDPGRDDPATDLRHDRHELLAFEPFQRLHDGHAAALQLCGEIDHGQLVSRRECAFEQFEQPAPGLAGEANCVQFPLLLAY